MKNTYILPKQTLELFGTAILTARLHMMVALTLTLLDIEWMDASGVIANKRLQRRCMSRVKHLTSRVRRVSAAILKVKVHNILLERKLDMLRTPDWRARVLKDLGGMARLKSWDAAWLRHLAYLAGEAPKRAVKPLKPEPVWWRSPERVAESERLKARFRLCEKACVNPRTFKDPFKVDFEGEFRLAPIPRPRQTNAASAKGKPRIYSKVDICEYGYDAMPIWKDFGVGLSTLYPMEFYAAMIVESKGEDEVEGEDELEGEDRPPSNLLNLSIASNDNHALIEFIGRKTYKYIFENPG